MFTLICCTELQAKFSAEQEAKVKAIERYNSSQHACSMLEMDIKNSRDDARKVSKELEIATEKVHRVHVHVLYISMCMHVLYISMCMYCTLACACTVH